MTQHFKLIIRKIKLLILFVEVNVTYKNAKVTNIYFSENEMQVDESYFFSSPPKKFIYSMIDSYRDLVSVRTEQQDEALTINLMSSKNKQIITISYMQLSELLANIGALINILMFMIMGLGNYINHYFFQNELMKSLFEFEDKSSSYVQPSLKQSFNELLVKSQNSLSILKDMKSIHSVNSLKPNHSEITRRHILPKEKPFKDIETILFSVTFIIPCIKLNKKYRNRIMKYASLERQLFLFQDLLNVYKKIQEIDILKYLLFTKRQLHIYETIPKPIIFQHKVNALFVPKKTIVDLYNEKTVIAIKKDIEQENINPKICNVRKKLSENNIEEKLNQILNERLTNNHMI